MMEKSISLGCCLQILWAGSIVKEQSYSKPSGAELEMQGERVNLIIYFLQSDMTAGFFLFADMCMLLTGEQWLLSVQLYIFEYVKFRNRQKSPYEWKNITECNQKVFTPISECTKEK